LTEEIERRLQARPATEWMELLMDAGVPAGPVLNVAECFANEQVKTLPVVATVEHPTLGTQKILGHGVNLERTPPTMRSATPETGQHTDEILCELGYDGEAISHLHEIGAV
jgi:crotonobetainyl-CoA:carnitine CoA-transferase CaiB-like acyl-CoA transferase